MANINKTLNDRESPYGSFAQMAETAQTIKMTFRMHQNWLLRLSWAQRESLDMIATKIARILNGDPNTTDSWHDIAGYATLVEEILSGNIIREKLGKEKATRHSPCVARRANRR